MTAPANLRRPGKKTLAILWHDLRFALRTLAKRPGSSLVLILILGLGLGATTAILDLANLLAWRKLPVARPGELVKVFTASHRGFVGPYHQTSYPDYLDYRDGSRSFSGLAAHAGIELRLDRGEGTEVAWGAAVSGNFFEVLELALAAGRPLESSDDRPASPPAMVIAHHLWQRLGRDPGVLGRTMKIEGRAFTVVGVGPPGFTDVHAGEVTDFFFPVTALARILAGDDAGGLEDRNRPRVYLIGRLRPGVSPATAQAELAVMAGKIDADHPLSDEAARKITVTAARITHPVDLQRMAPTLRLFAAAVALLLVITCANVANLLLARSSSRRREMGIRQAIGAGRGRLLRQLLTESLVLALAAGLCGLLLAYWARSLFVAFAGPEFAGEMRFDGRVLGATFLVCLAATALFGLVPALTASQVRLVPALKDGVDDGRRRFSAGQLLSAAQVALSVVLLAAGALLSLSLWNRLQADLGFDDRNLVLASVELPAEDYSQAAGRNFFRRLQERAEALPAVERAGLAFLVPPILFDITLPFQLPESPGEVRSSRINVVDGDYFRTLGIPLEEGRLFDSRDGVDGQPVAIINRRLAEELWPGESPLGRTIRSPSSRPEEPGPDFVVVGVVGNVAQHRAGIGGEPVRYFSTGQRHRPRRQLVVRSQAEPGRVVEALRGLLHEMDPRLALQSVRTGEANRREAFLFERMQASMVGVFAVLGFLLAAFGIFGVLSYAVSRQVREIGIRMALGARRRDVLRRVVGRGMLPALAGAGAGVAGTLLSSRLLESLLFGVEPGDARVLVAVVIAVLGAAFGAAYLPARRASRLNPLAALRHE